MPNEQNKEKTMTSQINWVKRIGLILAGLFLIYLILGFWVVPLLLKPKLEEQLSRLLGRQVTIAEINLNPLVCHSGSNDLSIDLFHKI